MKKLPLNPTAAALTLLAMTATPLAAQQPVAEGRQAPAEAATQPAPAPTSGKASAPTATAPTDATAAAPADPAADCAALTVLEDGNEKARKAATLAEQGLATTQNVIRAYNELGKAVGESLEESGYQTACYFPLLAAIKDSATPNIKDVSATIVSDNVVDAWADECAAMADAQGVSTCLTDVVTARADDLLNEYQTISMVNALPLDTVSFDETQMTDLLTLVKEQVEAGTLNTSLQRSIVDKMLNQ